MGVFFSFLFSKTPHCQHVTSDVQTMVVETVDRRVVDVNLGQCNVG